MTSAARLRRPPAAELSAAARRNAELSGDARWITALPDILRAVEDRWSITVGDPYAVATEAYVARAWQADGAPVVLKLVPPSSRSRRGPRSAAADQIAALTLSDGRGCARLLRHDPEHGAMLLERLGPSLADRGLEQPARMRILTAAARTFWCPVEPGHTFTTGVQKAGELARYIRTTWSALDKPCTARTVRDAMSAAHRRARAHDDSRAVLVHGDVHQWNALAAEDGYRLVDPHGIVAEPEFDLGVMMREDPIELLRGEPRARAAELAALTGCDEDAIWEWGVLHRVATGLLCTSLGMPTGPHMLAVADLLSG